MLSSKLMIAVFFKPVRLPTSRRVETQPVIILPIDFFVSLLFQAFRLLAVIPAMVGTIYNVYNVVHPPQNMPSLIVIDYIMCALWVSKLPYPA